VKCFSLYILHPTPVFLSILNSSFLSLHINFVSFCLFLRLKQSYQILFFIFSGCQFLTSIRLAGAKQDNKRYGDFESEAFIWHETDAGAGKNCGHLTIDKRSEFEQIETLK